MNMLMKTESKNNLHDSRDVVIYFSAGAMAGVFSAGFASVLSEHPVKQRIRSVYGNSAGSLTALNFLADQDEFGAALYWEDLSGKKYIRWSRLTRYFLTGVCNALFKTKFKPKPVFDIDYIERILKNKRPIDFSKIEKSNIDLYMIAYNVDSRKHDYLKVEKEEDVLPMLKATAGGQPAYPYVAEVGSQRYIDGGTINDKRRIERIIGSNPGKNIICVLNNPKFVSGPVKTYINKVLMALVMWPFFGTREARETVNSDFGNLEVEDLKVLFPHVYFIANDILGKQMSTDPHDHKRLYMRGQELAREFLASDEFEQMRPIC